MKVPLHIRRADQTRPVTALLVPGHDVGRLLQVCAELQLDAPRVFVVADGYIVKFPAALKAPVAGLVRLTEVGEHLLLPADGELLPVLLPDEQKALGSKRGLLFLPGQRVQVFDPNMPVDWGTLLDAVKCQKEGQQSKWQALPEPGRIADGLNEIVWERPDDSAASVIEPGGEGIGGEDSRPDDASLSRKMMGRTVTGMGQGLVWLGKMLQMPGLARAGAGMMGKGLQMFPRLSEKLLGRRESSLRELLRQFREGNIEKALRRAIPLNQNPGRGSVDDHGTYLPDQDTRYSLSNLLGGRGVGSIWFGSIDLFAELNQEYRKQALEATRRGDFRRAAFIYGKLLQDFRSAAAALSQGGLHHDAAILYLEMLHDIGSAAREFELGGESDRALQLYRQQGMHIQAGDLLMRLGDEELAVAEYRLAAEEMIGSNAGYHQAGELMLNKAKRPELAREYFRAGWKRRPHGGALSCAHQLAKMHAERDDCEALLGLLGEGEVFFAPSGNAAAAGEFFNHLGRMAQKPGLAAIREEMRERTLLALAAKLEQQADTTSASANAVGQLFPATAADLAEPLWGINLVSDARSALEGIRLTAKPVQRNALPQITPGAPIPVEASIPVLTTANQSPFREEIFLGFTGGEIVCFDPPRGSLTYLPTQPGTVDQLAFGDSGDHFVVLCQRPDVSWQLACFEREGKGSGSNWQQVMVRNLHVGTRPPALLPPINPLNHQDKSILAVAPLANPNGIAAPELLQIFNLPYQLPIVESGDNFTPIVGFLVLIPSRSDHSGFAAIVFDGNDMVFAPDVIRIGATFDQVRRIPGFALPVGRHSSMAAVRCVQMGASHFELVLLNEANRLVWARLMLNGDELERHAVASVSDEFRAAALVREGVVAAVGDHEIVHLRMSETRATTTKRLPIELPQTVACFVCHRTQELIVVSANGTLTRGPWLP